MTDELERSTLSLINSIATLGNSPLHVQQFGDSTGLRLTSANIRLIEFLSGLPPVPISQVASTLGIDLAQASRQIHRLVVDGHLQTMVDADDRRRTLTTLSTPTAEAMDRWLVLWSSAYRDPLTNWPQADLADFAECVSLQVGCLHAALPDQPVPSVGERWDGVAGPLPRATRAAGRAIVDLVTWVGQSRGFDSLLEYLDSPVRQAVFLTLRAVIAEGPLAVSELAALLSIDPSLASKRTSQLAELGFLERSPAPSDRRRILVSASPAGVTFEANVLQAQLQSFASILPRLSPARRRRWTSLMRRYLSTLDVVADRSR